MPSGLPPIGPMYPVVVLPRFTSYVGIGKQTSPSNDTSYRTDPMDVSAFTGGRLLFWRGPLVGGTGPDPFLAYFEESQDGIVWSLAGTTPAQPVSTANAFGGYQVVFTKRWFRIRVSLKTTGVDNVVAITLWMAGAMEGRVQSSDGSAIPAGTAPRAIQE